MGDDAHCSQLMTAGERGDLARGRADGVEEDRLDFGAQVAEDGLDVGDAGVEEEDLGGGDFAGAVAIVGWLAVALKGKRESLPRT